MGFLCLLLKSFLIVKVFSTLIYVNIAERFIRTIKNIIHNRVRFNKKNWGRPAVAVHFFDDFTLKMFTVVGLQASF